MLLPPRWRALLWPGHSEDAVLAGLRGDYALEVRLLLPLAEQGNPFAQSLLGSAYFEGKGVLQDYQQAVTWMRRAADQGYSSAQLNLGVVYANGQGVPQDFVLAHVWFNLSAAQGDEQTIKNRDRIAKQMTSDQIAEAQRMAREWKPKAEQ